MSLERKAMMIRTGIVGATGYAGAELVRLLAAHRAVEITVLMSRQFAGTPFDHVYPALSGMVDLTCEPLAVERLTACCDVVFTALPHRIPMEIVPALVASGLRVIDLSADFRFEAAAVYEAAYQPHTAPELLKQSVYGLCEVFAERIEKAALVGNPGCYPTSVLLPLIPLVEKRLLDIDSIVIDAKSGVSGAGRSPSLTSHYCEVNESFKAYKAAEHRHNPEIDAVLSRFAGRSVGVTFVPHLLPMTRGMLSTIYATPAAPVSADDVRECMRSYYHRRPFVRLCGKDRLPDTRHVAGSNFCDIGVRMDPRRRRLILFSAIDNLVKGAAGQAVQNMNIMYRLEESEGLTALPFPV